MRERSIVPVLLIGLLFVVAPCLGGIYYQAETRFEADQGGNRPQTTRVEAWINGEKAKIAFVESANPLAGTGTYVLTQDGGRTIYLVNPEQKTYSRWDVEGLLGVAGAMLQGLQGMVNLQFSEPQTEKLAEDAGESILGLATRHYRYRTAYSMDIKVIGIRQSSEVESVQDFWTTNQVSDVGLGVWLRKDPPRTGNQDFDRLLAEALRIEGFPLKTVTVTTQRQIKKKKGRTGKETTTRSTMEVTALRRESIADSTFALPAGYQEAPMPFAGEGSRNPLRGLLRRDP